MVEVVWTDEARIWLREIFGALDLERRLSSEVPPGSTTIHE